MRSYGSDRVRQGEGEQWIILCSAEKGWIARAGRTRTRAEFPGTAVLWEGRHLQVVGIRQTAEGIEYILEPWPDNHIIRVSDSYDEASERRRERERRAAAERQAKSRTITLLGMFAGHLPARVQEDYGSELGIVPARLTMMSVIPSLAVGLGILFRFVQQTMGSGVPVVGPLEWLGGYLIAESLYRFGRAFALGQAQSSVIGFICCTIYYGLMPRAARPMAPFAAPAPAIKHGPGKERALQDAFILREPFLTLLTPDEQKQMQRRFDYDYRTHAGTVAGILLFVAILGIFSSWAVLATEPRFTAFLSLLTALAVAIEQLVRMRAFRSGPAGSFLAPLVRPFTRKLFTS